MLRKPTAIQEIHDDITQKGNVRIFMKREDLNHPTIQGNKYWKLLYNLEAAQKAEKDTLITFGGAFSNHILATAAAGHAFGFKTIGIIRGEKVEPLNFTLSQAQNLGMQIQFVDRATYRLKIQPEFLERLKDQNPTAYIIPEGGTNHWAIKGCISLAKEIREQGEFDHVVLPVGTGGTLAGIILGWQNCNVLGFSSLKGNFLYKEVEQLIQAYNGQTYTHWNINNDYHFKGYARFDDELISFMNHFKKQHGISLDPIYTGKMMFGLYDMLDKGLFPKGSNILAIHTGGLQGIIGFNQRFGNLLL